MIVIEKNKILKIVLSIFLIIFIFAFSINNDNSNDYISTVTLPVSGKVVVVDARTRCTR